MSDTTPNLGLVKPRNASLNWGPKLNTDLDIIDNIFSVGTCGTDGLHALSYDAVTKTLGCNPITPSLASPGPIGGTTPSTGAFTSINGSFFAYASRTVQQTMTAAGADGLSEVPPAYTGVDIPAGTQINSLATPAASSQSDGAMVRDERFGQSAESFFNSSSSPLGNFVFAKSVIGNNTKVTSPVPSNQFLLGVQQNAYDGGSNYTGNKTNWSAGVVYHNGWAQGQHIAFGSQMNAYGSGDALSASFFSNCWGGANAPLDEGCEMGDISISPGNVAAVGTIASGGAAGATSLTLAFSAGSRTQGSGRYLIDTTQASSTGLVTAIAGSGPLTYTFSGVTMPTSTVTTDSTAIAAPGIATIATVGATTGITANSTLVCISDTACFECVIPTAVGANSITASFRKPHPSGATVSWGGNTGKLIELNVDRWAAGALGFITVQNSLRQAWPVVGCTSASACTVWASVAGNYTGYTGQAVTSAGSNAYTMYPGAEIISVQSGGSVSNTLALAPNNVAWANSDAVEVPLYPGMKIGLANIQINNVWPSGSITPVGAGISYNGILSGSDGGWGITNNTNPALYASGGGRLTAPFGYKLMGKFRYGLYMDSMADAYMLTMTCSGCTDTTANIAAVSNRDSGQGFDQITYTRTASAEQWNFTGLNGALTECVACSAKTIPSLRVTPVAFASLPSCGAGTEGTMRAVNNSTTATWGATITGGGTNHVLGYCDGTNWTVMAA